MATSSVQEVIGRDDIVWGFGPDMKPVLEVDPGAVVKFETNDCFTGQIQTEDDLVTGIDFDRVNSATGPVAVRGAEVGDSLVVEILDVHPIEWGVATIIPDMGQLIHKVDSPVTRRFEVRDGWVQMNDRIRFPARPMVGVVGVATGGEELTNAYAGRHGGNLDDHFNGPGSRLYFPVRQDGGMFAVGDMHANMGDGEICGTGVEISGEVTVRFDVVKNKASQWPVTELTDSWIVHGTETNQSPTEVTEAIALACEEAQKMLVDEWGMSREDAYIFMSVACDVGIAQACKPSPFSSIARVVIPKIEAIPGPWRF
jgi:amidase